MTDNRDKIEEQISSQPDGSVTDQPTGSTKEPTANRPAIKREYTPPHRVRIETERAWKIEHMYGNLHEHVRDTLNRVCWLDSSLTAASSFLPF